MEIVLEVMTFWSKKPVDKNQQGHTKAAAIGSHLNMTSKKSEKI